MRVGKRKALSGHVSIHVRRMLFTRFVVVMWFFLCVRFQCLPSVLGGAQGYAFEANCSLISKNVVLQKKLYTTSDFPLGHVFQSKGV